MIAADLWVMGVIGFIVAFSVIGLAIASVEKEEMTGPLFERGSQNGADWKTFTSLHVSAAAQASASAQSQLALANSGLSQISGSIYGSWPYGAYPEPDHAPCDYTGIEIGEITAWRAWLIRDGFLASATADCFWMPGEPVEGDISKWGVHAFKTYRDAFSSYGRSGAEMIVTGEVTLWGEIVEHEDGYRAQFGEVKSLKNIHPDNKDSQAELKRLRALYKVEE